jgi:serine/threonine protein phosphatase PrpC
MHRITDNASERDCVKSTGGKIISNRVNGVSAVSRTFGDTPLKTLHDLQCNTIHKSPTNGGTSVLRLPMKGNNSKAKLPFIRLVNESLVIVVPEIYTELITSQTDFASLASDGLWDTMSPQLAISFVRRHLSREKDVTEAAQAVAQEALRRGSIDNVTVLILTFNIGIQQS